jgi:alpha-glucosidase (family GH31 glycosyl hydrolase)
VYTPANRRTVYLPKGAWFDYWTGAEHQGPTTLHVEPPLEVLPLYVRGDSIIAMGPDMAYVGEKPFNPITLDIWLSHEAEATIYDDDEVISCRARKTASEVALDVSASKKSFIARLNKSGCPSRVSLNGVAMPRLASLAELEVADLGWFFDPSFVVYAKFNGLGSRSEVAFQV